MMPATKHISVNSAARDLLDALDRMHGKTTLSENVRQARDLLRSLLPYHVDPRDVSGDPK